MAKSPSRAWGIVAILWGVALLNYLDRQVIFSLFPLLKAEFAIPDRSLGLVSTSFLWIYGLFSPIGGFLADRFRRDRIIVMSLLVWSVITILTGRVQTFNQLIVARAAMGLSEACYIPAALALIADYHREHSRSLAIGIHQSGIYAGLILGGWLGGYFGEHYGWRFPFAFFGGIGAVYAFIVSRWVSDSNEERPLVEMQHREPKRLLSGEFMGLCLISTAFSIAGWIALTWMPLHLFEHFGMSLTRAGFTASFWIQGAAFLGILGGGYLADRLAPGWPAARLVIAAASLSAGGIFLTVTGSTSAVPTLITGLAFYGLSRGIWDCSLMPLLCHLAAPRRRAFGYGILNLAGTLAGGAMVWTAGALKASAGLATAIQGSGILLLLASTGLIVLLRSPKFHTNPYD